MGAPGVDYRTFNSGILKTRFQGPDLGFRLFFYSGILKGPVLNIYYYNLKQDAFFSRPGAVPDPGGQALHPLKDSLKGWEAVRPLGASDLPAILICLQHLGMRDAWIASGLPATLICLQPCCCDCWWW